MPRVTGHHEHDITAIVMLFVNTALPLSVGLKVLEKATEEEVSGLDEPRALEENSQDSA